MSSKETFEVSDMFIEAGANAVNGIISFAGGMAGGVNGLYIPGRKNGFENWKKHQGNLFSGDYYFAKSIISFLKNELKEVY